MDKFYRLSTTCRTLAIRTLAIERNAEKPDSDEKVGGQGLLPFHARIVWTQERICSSSR